MHDKKIAMTWQIGTYGTAEIVPPPGSKLVGAMNVMGIVYALVEQPYGYLPEGAVTETIRVLAAVPGTPVPVDARLVAALVPPENSMSIVPLLIYDVTGLDL